MHIVPITLRIIHNKLCGHKQQIIIFIPEKVIVVKNGFGVAAAVANTIQCGTNLKAAAEYISLLFRKVRDQEGSRSLRSCTLG